MYWRKTLRQLGGSKRSPAYCLGRTSEWLQVVIQQLGYFERRLCTQYRDVGLAMGVGLRLTGLALYDGLVLLCRDVGYMLLSVGLAG